MSANPLDIRLRGLDDLILESVKRIESLETTRAFHADTLKRIVDRVDKLSEAFRARTDELAGLLESAINLGQHQAAEQTSGNLRLGVSMDALQESLIRLQHDTANRIAGLSIDVRQLSNAVAEQDKKIVRLDNDDETIHAEMQSRTEQLSDRIGNGEFRIARLETSKGVYGDRIENVEKMNAALRADWHDHEKAINMLGESPGEFIRYVHADDLQQIIDERVHAAIADKELRITVNLEPTKETARRGNISIEDGQGNEKRDAPYNSRV